MYQSFLIFSLIGFFPTLLLNYFSRERLELDLDYELEELEDEERDELLSLYSESEYFLLLVLELFLRLVLEICYLRSLESSESDLDLLLLSLRNLGHSFFLLVNSVLPVAQFVTISTLVIGLWTFTLLRLARNLHLQGPALKLQSLLILNSLVRIISLPKILKIDDRCTMKA